MPIVGGSQDEKKPLLVEVTPRSLHWQCSNDTQKHDYICLSYMFYVNMKDDCCPRLFTILKYAKFNKNVIDWLIGKNIWITIWKLWKNIILGDEILLKTKKINEPFSRKKLKWWWIKHGAEFITFPKILLSIIKNGYF